MINHIEKLKATLESLPTLTERLQTWNKIIKDLDRLERESLESCISKLENSDLFSLQIDSIELFTFNDIYKKLFSNLLERLETPLKAYENRISELTNLDFKEECSRFREKEHLRCTEYANNLASKYFNEFTGKTSHWDYIHVCNSMVTGFLFQPNIFPCKNQEERDIREEVFRGFNPQSYCKVFSDKLKELFKQ